jgi:ankyrin repeat protein
LIQNGADVNLTTKLNQTPLHVAAGKNKPENIKILLSSTGLELNPVDSNGFTPLSKACASLSYDSASFLLEHGKSYSNLNINQIDKKGNTALHYTMEDNNYNMSLNLIKNGARYDIKNLDGKICFDLIEDKNMSNLILNYINNI